MKFSVENPKLLIDFYNKYPCFIKADASELDLLLSNLRMSGVPEFMKILAMAIKDKRKE